MRGGKRGGKGRKATEKGRKEGARGKGEQRESEVLDWESVQQAAETSVCLSECTKPVYWRTDWFLPTVSRLPSTMADNVNEESDLKETRKDELDWGYEEGNPVFFCVLGGCWDLSEVLVRNGSEQTDCDKLSAGLNVGVCLVYCSCF